jgi:hypothetical protein
VCVVVEEALLSGVLDGVLPDVVLPDDVEPPAADVPEPELVDGADVGADAAVLGITTLDSAETLVEFVDVR